MSRRRSGFIVMSLAALLVMPLSPTLAADAETEERLRREREAAEERARREQQPDVRLEQPTVPTLGLLPKESPCFALRNVRFGGERLNEFPWLEDVAHRYIGQCAGQQGVNHILREVGGEFVKRGYITTRAGLPAQDLSSGDLTFVVVPGVIRAIRFADESTKANWRTAFPSRPGDVLNLRDIEQGLEQLKRIPSQDVTMEIVPGEAPGESDIVLTLKRVRSYRVGFSLDDAGSDDTGKHQASVTGSLDNPFGLNDLVSVNLNKDAEREQGLGSRGDSISYSFPFGNWEFAMSANRYRYRQTVEGVSTSFVSSGESEGGEFSVKRLLHRDQTSKTHARLRVNKRENRSFIDDTEILTQRREVTSGELALMHRRYFGQVALDATLSHRQGVPWFDAQDDMAASGDNPTTRYRLQTIDVSVTVPFNGFGRDVVYRASARGQTTRDTLFGSDYFAIGSRYTVRGFDGRSTLSAERGWVWRNELGTPVFKAAQIYVGVDGGRVSGPGAELLAGRSLVGSVVGVRGAWKQLQYDVFTGWSLNAPEGFETKRPTGGFQLYFEW